MSPSLHFHVIYLNSFKNYTKSSRNTYMNKKNSQQPSNQLSSWVYVGSVPLSRESMLTYFHLTWLTSINLARSWLHTDINNTDTHSDHTLQVISQKTICWMILEKNPLNYKVIIIITTLCLFAILFDINKECQWMHTLGWVKYLKGSYSQYHAYWCPGS